MSSRSNGRAMPCPWRGRWCRTEVVLEALRAFTRKVPVAVVGAGTALNAQQLDRPPGQAQFAVSPG